METKKELLKIYSSYLPYELQFIYSRDIPSEVNAWKLVGLIDRKDSDSDFFAKAIRSDYKNQINITLSLIKPILYSMDYLTKEIEHKGESFVPYKKLGWGNGTQVIPLILSKVISYNEFENLLEWNFNVFNFSDSEYIKKETLNK